MDYREIIESRYNRENWQMLLHDIFGQKVQFYQHPQQVPVDESMAKQALYTGKITLPDGHLIAIYEVELSDSVVIERNRAGIRNLLCTSWRSMGCAGAFMFCFRKNEAVLRFSYVSEAFAFTEDGALKKESTDTKRFTYLLGEGHRSRTAIEQFVKLKASGLTLKDITKAFSVEALSDLFFKEYKKHYEDIIEYITGKRMVKVSNKWVEQVTGEPCAAIMQEFAQFPDAEKAVRDYVKKLMGRLVFIQFLQKKGWMGCSAGEDWNDGDKEFVQNLFANTQYKNTFVDDVLEPLFDDINTKRNGDIANAVLGTGIKVPYLNGGLFEHDDYDETTFPLPAKYMKSLLDFFSSYNFTIDENDPDDAEIGVDPEMLGRIFENLLEDNKDKGAFYTPKEIVQYMCRESLIAYLQTEIEDETVKESIRQFVTKYDAATLSEDLASSVDQKLKDVKICDPAIGSGAFPMGLLRELYACRKAIEGIDDETAVRIKTEIIQNNIYGVDIEKGAVDIARLRFWLALIVDEKTPHALPNMDFKIMQGNSLLEQYEGVDLSGMSLTEQKKRKAKKGDAYQTMLAFDESIALENIQKAIKQYYLTDSHDAKVALRKTIDGNVKSYILNLKGCTPDIQRKLENLPIPNDQFFLWHIYFKEVFDKGGFDIVIANPPYGYIFKKKKDMNLMLSLYSTAEYKVEAYSIFVEHGVNILKDKGTLCYITPYTFISGVYFSRLRDFLNKYNMNTFVVLGKKIFETAEVDTGVYIVKKDNESGCVRLADVREEDNGEKLIDVNYWELSHAKFMAQHHNVLLMSIENEVDLYNKLYAQKDIYLLSDCVEFYHGIQTRGNKKSLLPTCEPNSLPIVKGADFNRYTFTGANNYIIPSRTTIKSGGEIVKYTSYPEKILVRTTADSIVATIDTTKSLALNSVNIANLKKNDLSLYAILGIMNSKLMDFWYRLTVQEKNKTFAEVKIVYLERMPILYSMDILKKIDAAVRERLKRQEQETLESEIDRLVYDLYGLTEDEIKIVEESAK